MQIYEVTDPLFKEYGKIIDSVELTELLAEMKHTPVPEDVVYVASEPKLEALAVMKELTDKTYGELPIQIGYCNPPLKSPLRSRVPLRFPARPLSHSTHWQ